MQTIKIKVTAAKALEICDFYGAKIIDDPKRPYDFFQTVSQDGVLIKAYRTKSPDSFTVTFQGGEKALLEASIFEKDRKAVVVSDPDKFQDIGEQIGSDEVGVGDFFGPMVVTASYFLPGQLKAVEEFGVRDSKKLTDAKMLEIGHRLCQTFKHYTVFCSAQRLSDYVDQGFSNHWVLAKLHDLAQRRLKEKYDIPDDVTVFIDQFEPESLYRSHAGSQIIQNPLIFMTKGESKFPSVAVSSVIARYEFLKIWAKMEQDLGLTIPKGAGSQVDKAYLNACALAGKEKTAKYVKRFFRNYKDKN